MKKCYFVKKIPKTPPLSPILPQAALLRLLLFYLRRLTPNRLESSHLFPTILYRRRENNIWEEVGLKPLAPLFDLFDNSLFGINVDEAKLQIELNLC